MKITAPGKLMLSGEWSVLEDGVPCLVMAIDRKVFAEMKESEEICFTAKGFGIEKVKATFGDALKLEAAPEQKEKLLFVTKAVEAALKYLRDSGKKLKMFELETNSEDAIITLSDGKKAKVGFGSSAAIVAATVAAVFAYHGEEIESKKAKEKIFKLGCIAHFLAQGKIGSSFDVAASTYGGVLVYQKPDMKWVTGELGKGASIKKVVDSAWPLFLGEPIALPKNFLLSIGFVGYSASTKELILKLNDFKKERKEEYDKIISGIKGITVNLIKAIKESNEKEIISLLKKNRVLLKELSDKSNNNLETKELALLADLADQNGAAGKFSGAGGGDCGIAISFDKKIKKKVEAAWKAKSLYPIGAGISMEGVSSE
ncbi:MAG: phosphomevalonate kinase [Candidatus Diapherotrites archaeon]|nr:phosphomevalonate kinase [Candidatus Diapherotrites archaeon]